MVSVAVSKLGCTNLIFVEPGAKINGQYYRDVLLMQELLPAIRITAGDVFVSQQDNAPAHRAGFSVELLRCEISQFISPGMWPADSPDLNPPDYRMTIDQWRKRVEACDHAEGGHFKHLP